MLRAAPSERLAGLEASHGLSTAQVRERAARYGENRILEAPPSTWLLLLRETLKDPMLWFLLGTSALFALVGQWNEALIMLLALIPFLGMDAFLHRRTQASTEGLASRLASRATVLRDGTRTVIEAVALVPGDLVLVGAGESFPADGVIMAGELMQADESALTGEAFPVAKLPVDADLLQTHVRRLGSPEASNADGAEAPSLRVDGAHWGLAGTRLLTGQAQMRVLHTGGETLYGEIVRSAIRGEHARTPLQSAVASLVTALLIAASIICVALAWVRYRQGHGLLDAVLSALTLAVAALPEEFPVVLTFFLGVGVYRLAKRQALVRRAVAVENIGRVSCICSDKTGTLTEGRLQLTHFLPAPELDDARLLQLAAAASRRETSDPMDTAILDALGSEPEGERIASFPFTEDRKRETGIVQQPSGMLAALKGAPEVVLDLCTLSATERAHWLALIEEYASSGHKVIACAHRRLDAGSWTGGEPDRGFVLAGLLCFEDPVREGAQQAIALCRAAQIQVIMVTGDHPQTARAVARELGLLPAQAPGVADAAAGPRVLEGAVMAARLAAGDAHFLREVDVIARAIPSQKLELVRALQALGEIVAVTGDGVNDVPALQAADIGIAMGERGTRSAREVAAIVLLDDNFRSIVAAIAEGRQLFSNLQLSFQYLLMIHLPLVVTAGFLPLAGYPLLYLPVHIVWLELIIHPTALLVFQELPASLRLVSVEKTPHVRFFDRAQWLSILAVGALVTGVIVGAYLRSLGVGHDVEHARAVALAVLTAASAGITTNLSGLRTRASQLMVAATLGSSLLLIQTPALAGHLHLSPLHVDDWALALSGGLLVSLPALLRRLRGRS